MAKQPSGRQEAFNEWYESVCDFLTDQYGFSGLWLSNQDLKEWDWKKLWKIFQEHVEGGRGAKDQMESEDFAKDLAGDVILKAHGTSYNHLDMRMQMREYLNSDSYD